MWPMSLNYQQLLDATIQHLEELKAQGVKSLSLSPETLAALASPRPRPTGVASADPCRSPAPPPPNRPAFESAPAPPQSTLAASPAIPSAPVPMSLETTDPVSTASASA